MTLIRFICLLIICAAPLRGSSEHEDYYTSIAVLEKLLELEHHLLHNLRDYVDQEVAKNHQITLILEDFESENAKALNHSQEYFGNPINVFRTIKRSVVDLENLQTYILDGTNANLYGDNISMNKSIENLPLPDEEDLKGAVLGLERLQTTYKLDTSEFADGKFFGVQHGPRMSASDSFYMGVNLYNANKSDRALEWFSTALEKFNKQTIDEREDLDEAIILEWNCAAALQSGKPEIARQFLTQLFQVNPNNKYAIDNENRIDTLYFEKRNTPKDRVPSGLKRVRTSPIEVYQATCRGENKLTPTEERPLRCMYVDNDRPFLKIAPFKMEQLSLDPLVAYFHDVIYENEIQQIINVSKPALKRSEVGEGGTTPSRTSQNAWLDYGEYEFLVPLGYRIMHMTNLSLETGEMVQVANYGIGGFYILHPDFADDGDDAFGNFEGNRMATALINIGHVELGGATAFPILKLAVKPIRGSLIFWYNLHDSGDTDNRTLHAGCPVLKGSKWIFTQWIHERAQEFLRPCGLQSTSKGINQTASKAT